MIRALRFVPVQSVQIPVRAHTIVCVMYVYKKKIAAPNFITVQSVQISLHKIDYGLCYVCP